MAKDPAFLFYPNDYIGGTMGMTFEQKGAYIELLMAQFNRGHMTTHMIGQVLGHNGGHLWENLKSKFSQDENGMFYNERLEIEKNKRKAYTDSRKKNVSGINQYSKNKVKKGGRKTGHMTSHMENENDNENININKGGVGGIFKPCSDYYFELYEKRFDIKPTFGPAEGKHLKELIKKLTDSVSQKNSSYTDLDIIDSFKMLLNRLPKFYQDKIDLKTINSKYDAIIAEIKSKSGASAQNSMQDIYARRDRERKANASGGKEH